MKIEKDYRKAVHFLPSEKSHNARCLNGSYHIKKTKDINLVTCEKCLNKDTAKEFWHEHFNPQRIEFNRP